MHTCAILLFSIYKLVIRVRQVEYWHRIAYEWHSWNSRRHFQSLLLLTVPELPLNKLSCLLMETEEDKMTPKYTWVVPETFLPTPVKLTSNHGSVSQHAVHLQPKSRRMGLRCPINSLTHLLTDCPWCARLCAGPWKHSSVNHWQGSHLYGVERELD